MLWLARLANSDGLLGTCHVAKDSYEANLVLQVKAKVQVLDQHHELGKPHCGLLQEGKQEQRVVEVASASYANFVHDCN